MLGGNFGEDTQHGRAHWELPYSEESLSHLSEAGASTGALLSPSGI